MTGRDLSGLRRVGISETSARRGQDYERVRRSGRAPGRLRIAGRDARTVVGFAAELVAHGGQARQIAEVCQAMSAAYREGVGEHLPDAQITFHRLHLAKLLSAALTAVRREERAEHRGLLVRDRYLFPKRPERLSDARRAARR